MQFDHPDTVIKQGIAQWQESIYISLKDIEHDYSLEHDISNEELEYKEKGYTRFRVRKRETLTGVSIAIEWYKFTFFYGKNERAPRSAPIKKGASEKALLNNIKRVAHPWELELAKKYVIKLRPYQDTLKHLGKISRHNYAAIKTNPIVDYVKPESQPVQPGESYE